MTAAADDPSPARAASVLRTLDLAFADVLRRADHAHGRVPDERVLLAAALACQAIAEGHAAFDPRRVDALLDDTQYLLEAGPWCKVLAGSPWVDRPAPHAPADPARPLVLENGLLYLRRYREYERRLALGLRRLAAQATGADTGDVPPALAALFAQLFPQAGDDADGGQARAARMALAHPLLLVTGGPGTGKTTTIARLLVLLAAAARDAGEAMPRIALAAPTGRAADRMAQSLRAAVEQMRNTGVEAALCDALPARASTLHRLLGAVPDAVRFRHDAEHPLAFDVIVVDEASMVDLPLMCKLVEAVPDGARLILLGDPDQLPSVEAGDVLSAIVAATRLPHATEPSPVLPARPRPRRNSVQRDLFDAQIPPPPPASLPPDALAPRPARVHLTRGFRQSAALELAPLAAAVREGDADRALGLLRGDTLRGVHFHPDRLDLLASDTRAAVLADWRTLADAHDPAAALTLADRTRVLCAVREGAQGAVMLNARIEEALAGAQRERYFHGRLLLVTENSYRHGLFNGDIGVCLRDADGASVAWFPGGGEGVRAFHPAALPAHDSAFAMTVHKAQGSEYATVWLQLPRHEVRTLSRELVYTALTRARDALHVAGTDAALRWALERHVQRISGLAARLG